MTGQPTRVVTLGDGTEFPVSSLRNDESRVWNNHLHDKGPRPNLGRNWIGPLPVSSGGSSLTGSSSGTGLSEPSFRGETNDLSSPLGSGLLPHDLQPSEDAPRAEQGRELINLALSPPGDVTPYTPQTTRRCQEEHTPETKAALKYGQSLAFHAMETNDSNEMMVGWQALSTEEPKKEVVDFAKATLDADRRNNKKWNPSKKDVEGARAAAKFTKRVAFFSQNSA